MHVGKSHRELRLICFIISNAGCRKKKAGVLSKRKRSMFNFDLLKTSFALALAKFIDQRNYTIFEHSACLVHFLNKYFHNVSFASIATRGRIQLVPKSDRWTTTTRSITLDIGLKAKPPVNYLVFAVKHNGRHKARPVADEHITDVPIDFAYSGIVSLRGFRLTLFLAELNDIWNVYLEAESSEKAITEAGPDFSDRYCHFLIVRNVLYALRCSGARWYDKLIDHLRNLVSVLASPNQTFGQDSSAVCTSLTASTVMTSNMNA